MAGETIQITLNGESYIAVILFPIQGIFSALNEEIFYVTMEVTGNRLKGTTVSVRIPAADYSKEELIIKVKNELPSAIEKIFKEEQIRVLAFKVGQRLSE